MKEITLILRFVVIGLIYIILFRLTRIMLRDMKLKIKKSNSLEFALEVIQAPDQSGLKNGTLYPLIDDISVGRSEKNVIVINDPFVSLKHGQIFKEENKVYLKDLKSTNGILLNNQKIEDITELIDGDIIEIGRVTFKVIG